MHFGEGEIRAYLDQVLNEAQTADIRRHLEDCPTCREQAAVLQNQAQWVEDRLSILTPGSPPIQTASAARRRLAAQITHKEKLTMWNTISRHVPRIAWVALAIIFVFAISFAFDPVRAIANSFLGLFRVEQIRVVEIDPESLPQKLGNSSNLEYLLSENIQIEGKGEHVQVESAAEASKLAGINLRLPSQVEEPAIFIIQPGGSASMNIDLDLVASVLKDIGRPDIVLPQELDGAVIKIMIPTAVAAQFGNCDLPALDPDTLDPDMPIKRPPVEPNNCVTLLQMPSPEISGPPELDLNQIGEAYLQLLGMAPEEAAQFARNVEWGTTFVVPIPRYGVEYEQVSVDGVTGTLINQASRNLYALVWIKDGILYSLSGTGDQTDALQIAASIQ